MYCRSLEAVARDHLPLIHSYKNTSLDVSSVATLSTTNPHRRASKTSLSPIMPVPTREFAKTGEQVGCIGYGAMGLAAFYGEAIDDAGVAKIFDRCLADGVNFWDTADMYSPMTSKKLGYNEEQIARYFQSHPEARKKVFLATKFVNKFDSNGERTMDGSPEWCHQACNDSLKRLGVDQIDLYYAHRPDPKVDVTETVKAMKELKDQGKIRYIGVSEYNVKQLEAANKIAHIDALQIEVSPWTPEALTNGILEWCEKNNTGKSSTVAFLATSFHS